MDNLKFASLSDFELTMVAAKESDVFQVNDVVNDMDTDGRRIFLGSILATTLILLASMPETAHASAVDYGSIDTSSTTISTTVDAASAVDWSAIFQKASKKALGGGKAGASAAVVQVFSLMWLRTSMNYQYRYGGDLVSSLKTLWSEGGIPRLYQGLPFALVQGPLTRFGDTAANVGILALLESTPETQALPLPVKTLIGKENLPSYCFVILSGFAILTQFANLIIFRFLYRLYHSGNLENYFNAH